MRKLIYLNTCLATATAILQYDTYSVFSLIYWCNSLYYDRSKKQNIMVMMHRASSLMHHIRHYNNNDQPLLLARPKNTKQAKLTHAKILHGGAAVRGSCCMQPW